MIELENVTKLFGKRVAAVSGITLTINQGEIFGLVGPDGAGKTTLIRLMTGIYEPTSGSLIVLGEHKLERVKGELGYVPQKFSLYTDLTVIENIRFIGALYGASRKEIETLAQNILTFTNLWPFRDRLADKLSGGMKQKLALAAGLMHKPKLFFLDEPTTGVDPVSRREFWQMLYQLNRDGTTIVVSTPYMDEAELCSRVAFMHNSKITACASPGQLRSQYPFRVLELQVSSKDVKSLVKECPIFDINAFGDKYHLVVDEPEVATKAVDSALRTAGIQEIAIREIPPTMEDVFVALAKEAS